MQQFTALFLAGLLSTAGALSAQTRPSIPALPQRDQRYESILNAARRMGASGAEKSTGTKQRLSAMADYQDLGGGLQKEDSSIYRYSGQRSSAYDFDALGYNLGYSYEAFAPLAFVDYDTSYSISLNGNAFQDTGYTRRDAAGRVTRTYQSGSTSTDYSYSSQGNVAGTLSKAYDGSLMQWVNEKRTGYAYNAQNKPVADTTYAWDAAAAQWMPGTRNSYTYGSGSLPVQITGSSWNGTAYDPSYRVTLSYNTAGKMVAALFETRDNGVYVPAGRDTFAYASSGMLSYQASSLDLGAGLMVVSKEFRHFNSAGLPDNVSITSLQDPFSMTYDTTTVKLSYNSEGNPVSQRSYEQGATTPQSASYYYYAAYQTSQAVAEAPVRKSLALYPNPTASSVKFRAESAGSYLCTITNSAGQSVSRSSISCSAGGNVEIMVESFPAGMYWLQFQGSQGSFQGRFLKQ